ncbi:MAG: hypothetical protein WKF84_02035 [Pyrinomonadaceae bacterium]
MANGATLAGHVTVEDGANIGAYSGVHQFCRVGREAYIGGYSVIVKDALPFALSVGNHARCYGLNTTGMKRRSYPRPTIAALRQKPFTCCYLHASTLRRPLPPYANKSKTSQRSASSSALSKTPNAE